MTGRHPKVENWATDFDHTDPEWVENPFPIWDELREQCPVAHSNRYGGVWLPTRHQEVAEVAYDTERFTSRSIIVTEGRPMAPAPVGVAPPISSDPPFHHDARRMLLPAFSPKAVEALREFTTTLCEGLLDKLEGSSVVDISTDYAQYIPVAVIAKMLGFPDEDQDLFRQFVHNTLEAVDQTQDERIANFGTLIAYIGDQLADHRANPRDDLTSFLLNAELDGEPLSEEHIMGTIGLTLIAGIDTTWSAIGAALWHLAKTPDDLHAMATDPEIWPTAVEELLRAYAPVTMARLVKQDCEFAGEQMKEDEWVLLPFPSANRDPEAFDNPDHVDLWRRENRHLTFGLGIHRCLGSNLARMEFTVALQSFIKRYPNFSLDDPASVRWSGGQVRGPRACMVKINAN
ncbi:MAG: cytochrome P450 [Actinomycetes bacterium]